MPSSWALGRLPGGRAQTYFTIGLPKDPKRPRGDRRLKPGGIADRLRCASPGDILYVADRESIWFRKELMMVAKREGVSLNVQKMVAWRVAHMTEQPFGEYVWRLEVLGRAWVHNKGMSMSRRAQD